MRKTVVCGDGLMRTGTVVYIHPEHRFETLEFEGRGGNWRESFYLPIPIGRLASGEDAHGHAPQLHPSYGRNRQFTDEQIRVLTSDMTLKQMAATLGCDKSTISKWRKRIGATSLRGKWRSA